MPDLDEFVEQASEALISDLAGDMLVWSSYVQGDRVFVQNEPASAFGRAQFSAPALDGAGPPEEEADAFAPGPAETHTHTQKT